MTFKFSSSSEPILKKLMEQGIDINNIPVQIEKVNVVNGNLEIIISPAIRPKDKYQLEAKKDCRYCLGHGYISYVLDQDDIKSAPCYICFPETAEKSNWLREATK